MRNPENLICASLGIAPDDVSKLVADTLVGCDDGEGYFAREKELRITMQDGHIRSAVLEEQDGGSLRRIIGEKIDFASFTGLSENVLRQTAAQLKSVPAGTGTGLYADPATAAHPALYPAVDAENGKNIQDYINLLTQMHAYAHAQEQYIVSLTFSLSIVEQDVMIVRPTGRRICDPRLLVRLNTSVVLEQNGKKGSGGYGMGGRYLVTDLFDQSKWQFAVDEALRVANVDMIAQPAPGGEALPVVLGSGWCGILLHEAIGHGLEGDFIRKKSSVFTNLLGQQIAHPEVTVVDDGTIPGRRGSLTVDDEGTPTQRNVLIENGKLVGFLWDRHNARLAGVLPTGSGRRESATHAPMPRMNNTFMLSGNADDAVMFAGVKRGIYAVGFSNGSVDITSGNYNFNASEAYMIEDGRITTPIKGVVLSGVGHETLKGIDKVGATTELDPGIGTCGKNGQGVPVGVGQPKMRIKPGVIGIAGSGQ